MKLTKEDSGCSPVSGAFEPVEDVGAAGVINLVERVSVRLLHGNSITAKRQLSIIDE